MNSFDHQPKPSSTGQIIRQSARMRGKSFPMMAAIIAVIALGGIAWGVVTMTRGSAGNLEAESRTAGPVWFDVRRQNLELAIVSAGELETKRKVEIKSLVEGTTTIVEVVPEGQRVKEGDVVMRLADDDIRTRIETELLSLEQAKSDFVTAQQTLAIEQTDAESDLRAAQVKLDLIRLDMAKWESGDDPQKKRELSLALEKAKRTLTRDKRDLELSEQLHEQKFISLSELEDDQIAVIEAENTLKTATQNISVYNDYTRPKEFQKLVSDVAQAAESLDRSKRRAEININRAKSTLAVRTRTLHIREERLEKYEDQLKATIVVAPQDGLVVYGTTVGNRRGRSDPIAQGRQVRFNELLIVLPDTREMVAAVKINETMMPVIRVGQKAAVTSDYRPGLIMEGTVSQLGVMAEDGGWFNPDIREYGVRIDLPPGIDDDLKPAMRCTARILIGKLDDVLAVPLQAVVTESKQRYVYVPAADGKVEKRNVTIGKNNESMVEIKEGLAEGDRVLLRRPRPGELLSPADAPATDAPKADKPATGPNENPSQPGQPTQAPSQSGAPAAQGDNAAAGNGQNGERRRRPRGERGQGNGAPQGQRQPAGASSSTPAASGVEPKVETGDAEGKTTSESTAVE